jgi:hypothetical protein
MQLPDVIARYITAYNAMNVPDMVACLARDVVFRNVSDGTVDAETADRTAFAELAELGRRAFSERTQAVTNAITVLDTTLVEIDYTARIATDLPNGWKAGQTVAFKGASEFTLRDGLIARIVDVH